MLGYDSVQQKTLPKFHYMYLIKQLGINLVPWVHETCLLRSSYMKVFYRSSKHTFRRDLFVLKNENLQEQKQYCDNETN